MITRYYRKDLPARQVQRMIKTVKAPLATKIPTTIGSIKMPKMPKMPKVGQPMGLHPNYKR